jgi:hypothetical protein
MKKQYYFIAAIMLMFYSLGSFASVQTFWAYGSSDNDSFIKSRYVNNINSSRKSKDISIAYNIEDNWTINSAKLWVRAVDDFQGRFCSRKKNCNDNTLKGRDLKERQRISNIEGRRGRWGSRTVNRDQWYGFRDVTTFLINDPNNIFNAKLKAIRGRDLWYRNAKLVIDYDIKTTTPTTGGGAPVVDFGPPVVVPLPPAIWLFGSALMGILGLKRKSVVSG